MVDLYTGTVPNLTQSQPDFDTNTQTILDYIAEFAPQLNEWVGAYVQDTSTVSSTSNTIGTGSKTFTVESNKGYKVNMPVRASATTGNYMDGIVTAYSGTSLTVNFSSSNGSGTFTSWQIFLTVPGSNVTLGSNTFTGDQIVPDEAYDASGWNGDLSVPTKNAVRDKIEAILSAILNTTNDPTFTSTSSTDPVSAQWTHGAIKSDLNATGSAPLYACRAWVNFNGSGTPSIRASGNVSSITDNGTGDYTINFITPMQDANYAVDGVMQGNSVTVTGSVQIHYSTAPLHSSVRVFVSQAAAATQVAIDSPYVCVKIHR